MAEELKYRLFFTMGSLEGQMFPLGTEPVIVGRSHTCGIRVMEPDVSGRHVLLSVGRKGVGMEVISSRRTTLDGTPLKTGDKVQVRAGQRVAMGGIVEFAVECYRGADDKTEVPENLTDAATRLRQAMSASGGGNGGDAIRRTVPGSASEASSRPTSAGRAWMAGDDDDTGTHIPASPSPGAAAGAIGPLTALPFPPANSGGETLGTEALSPSADTTQILQTRAATPQEMAYMRELHNKKRRRKTGVRLALGGLLVLAAIVVYAVWDRSDPFIVTSQRKDWKVLDAQLKPIPAGEEPAGRASLFLSYPPAAWGSEENSQTGTNAALGVEESIFSVKTRVGRNLEIPLQLKLIVYASAESLHQSQEESFADWDRTNVLGLEKQTRLSTDFFGANPGIPCLRYTYTRKATPGEEAEGVSDWAGVLSFFRLRDTCFAYFREVPGVEGLRAEAMLLRTAIFLGIDSDMVQERWAGMPPERQYRGELPILRNSVRELMDKNMDNEWEEIEDKLCTILIRTFPRRMQDDDAGRLYGEALEWMRILRARQTGTWKMKCLVRCRAAGDKDADTRRMDEEIRGLFRSPNDRRHLTAQKDKWWVQ